MQANLIKFAITIATAASAWPVTGQTQAEHDRLNRVAQFIVTASLCGKLGMKLDPDLPTKAEATIGREAAGWNVGPAIIERLKGDAVKRQGSILKTDLEAAAAAAKTDAQLRNVRNILLGYGRTCLAAAADPIFSRLIITPAGYDPDRAATAAADEMLEAGGLASWQTPRIQARGDVMMAAGACRSKIGPARSDAIVREFGQSDDPRVRNYYARSFHEGLANPTIISTLAGCNRAIAGFRLKAK